MNQAVYVCIYVCIYVCMYLCIHGSKSKVTEAGTMNLLEFRALLRER